MIPDTFLRFSNVAPRQKFYIYQGLPLFSLFCLDVSEILHIHYQSKNSFFRQHRRLLQNPRHLINKLRSIRPGKNDPAPDRKPKPFFHIRIYHHSARLPRKYPFLHADAKNIQTGSVQTSNQRLLSFYPVMHIQSVIQNIIPAACFNFRSSGEYFHLFIIHSPESNMPFSVVFLRLFTHGTYFHIRHTKNRHNKKYGKYNTKNRHSVLILTDFGRDRSEFKIIFHPHCPFPNCQNDCRLRNILPYLSAPRPSPGIPCPYRTPDSYYE